MIMKSIEKHIVSEKEIKNAIRQVCEDKEVLNSFKSVSETEIKNILENERKKLVFDNVFTQLYAKIMTFAAGKSAVEEPVHVAAQVRHRTFLSPPLQPQELHCVHVAAEVCYSPEKVKTKTAKILFYSASSVAASILIILMLTIFKKESPQNLYMAYCDMPVFTPETSRGTSETVDAFFDLYNKGLFDEALDTIKLLGDEDLNEEPLMKFYVSACYLKSNDLSKAKKYLSELNKDYPKWQEVQWYLSLVYLKEGQTNEAKKILQKIDDEKYAGKAKELLEKLK